MTTEVPVKIGKQLVQLRIDTDLLAAIDQAARRERMTRTAWMVQAALNHLPMDLGEAIERA